ncbi:MAG: M20/M25/M40 family metallo-hydrolase [Chlamydiota bacterium]
MIRSSLRAWYKKQESAILSSYLELLQIPSISTDPTCKTKMQEAACWVAAFLQKSGLESEILPTKKHPLVFAEAKIDPKKPTILLYGHYDVQPADPLDEWNHPPFSPKVEGDLVYARGAQDNKGQLIYLLYALKALHALGEFPCNIKVLVEGEEEISSPSLGEMLPNLQKKIQADYLLIVDGGLGAQGEPAITLGCRGIVALEVEVEGSLQDLHSGQYGNAAYNPLRALSQIVGALWDLDGKIVIPGFYDGIRPFTDLMKCAHFPRFSLGAEAGLLAFWQEKGFSPEIATKLRPSLEVHGYLGGYQQEGFKTVIPKKASVKLSSRLVPGQDPVTIYEKVRSWFLQKCPSGMKMEVRCHGLGSPLPAHLDSPLILAAKKAYEEVFQSACQAILSGGSIPVAANLGEASGAKTLIIGMGLSSDAIHAPNEHFSLKRVEQGFYIVVRLLELLESNDGDLYDAAGQFSKQP